jgi:predicted nuclease with TOPRIM domain
LTDSLYRLRTHCQDDELREFAKNLKEVKTTKKSKYEKAIENLKSLGVEPNRLMEYIKKNQKDI